MQRIVTLVILLAGCAGSAPQQQPDTIPEPLAGVNSELPDRIADINLTSGALEWSINQTAGVEVVGFSMDIPAGTLCNWSIGLQFPASNDYGYTWFYSISNGATGIVNDFEYEGPEDGGPPIAMVRTGASGYQELGGAAGSVAPMAFRMTTQGTFSGEFEFWLAATGLGGWESKLVSSVLELAFNCDGTLKQTWRGNEFFLKTPMNFGDGAWAATTFGGGAHVHDAHEVELTSSKVLAIVGAHGYGVLEYSTPARTEQVAMSDLTPTRFNLDDGPGKYTARTTFVTPSSGMWATYLGAEPDS